MLINRQLYLPLFFSLILFCSCSRASEVEIIPINLSTHTPIINAKIEETKVRLSFDSGAHTPLIIKKEILNHTSGVTFTGKYRHSIDAAGKKHKNPEFKLAKILLGTYERLEVIGNVYAPWGLWISADKSSSNDTTQEQRPPRDGVFGLDLFEGKHLIIDYPSKKLVVLHKNILPDPYNSLKWTICNQNVDENGMVMHGIFRGKKGRFLLDTGATGSFLRPSFLGVKSKKKSITDGFQTDEGIALGKVKFYLHEFVEPQVDGILGYDFFADKKIYVETGSNNLKTNTCFISPI